MNDHFRGSLALAIAIVLASIIGSCAFVHVKSMNNTIQVTGSSKKRIKSDLIIWKTSVIAEAARLPDAYNKLSADVEKVRAFLVAKGVPANQIVTSAVGTTARRQRGSSRPAEMYEGAPGAGMDGPITGYNLRQTLEVRSTEIDKITVISRQVTELIHQGIFLESEEPQYLYTKLADVKVEILADAAKDAMARAQQIAASTGSTVGKVRSADMGVLQITAADSTEVSGYGMNDTRSLEKDITAVVHITFALN